MFNRDIRGVLSKTYELENSNLMGELEKINGNVKLYRREYLYSMVGVAFFLLGLRPSKVMAGLGNTNVEIRINNKTQYLGDLKPFIGLDNRVMVPLRFITEKFGAEVIWDEITREIVVMRGGKNLLFKIGSNKYFTNDLEKEMDALVISVEGVTYVPLRYIVEEFGLEINFVAGDKVVIGINEVVEDLGSGEKLKDKSVYPLNRSELYSYNDLVSDLNWLKSSYGELVEIKSLGKSSSGVHDIWCIVIGEGSKNIVIDGTLHGNEWVNTMFCVEQIKEYLRMFKSGESYKGRELGDILREFTFHFIPCVNPDGLELSQNGVHAFPDREEELVKMNKNSYDFRYWKSNINGVDLNRNFDTGLWSETLEAIKRGARKGSFVPSGAFYSGISPFDQVETEILSKYIVGVDAQMILDYHSSGQILYWQFNQSGDKLKKHKKIADEIRKVTGYSLGEKSTEPNTTINRWGVECLGIPSITIETVYPNGGVGGIGNMKFREHFFKDRNKVLYATLAAVLAL